MNRRPFLSSTALGLAAALAGCLGGVDEPEENGDRDDPGERPGSTDGPGAGEPPDAPPLEDDDRYEAAVASSTGHLFHGDLAGLIRSPADVGRVVFRDPETDDGAAELRSFLAATDYDESAVLYYRTSLPNPCTDLHLEDVTVGDDVVTATFDSHREEGTTCASAEVEVAACVRLPDADLPDRVRIERDGAITNRYALELEPLEEAVLEDRLAIVATSDLPAAARGPLRDAIEDGVATLEDVPDALSRALADHEWYRLGGEYYRVDATVPERVLTAEVRDADDVDADPEDETVLDLRDLEDESEPAADAVTTAMSGESVRTPALPPALADALEAYDYVYRRPTFVELAVSVDDPGAPYRLEASAASRDEIYDEIPGSGHTGVSVVDVTELPGRVRSAVEAALEGGRETLNPPWLLAAGYHRNYLAVDGGLYRPVVTDVDGTADVRLGPPAP